MSIINVACLSYAGGSSVPYLRWGQPWAEGLALHPMELPGRGKRTDEPLLTDVASMVNDYIAQIMPLSLLGEYALFGHSLGALLSYEIALRLRELGLPPPSRVFFSGAKPPHVIRTGAMHQASDAELIEYLRRYGTMSDRLVDNAAMLDFFTRILRADYRALETHPWSFNGPLECPITVITAQDDPATGGYSRTDWASYTTGDLAFLDLGAAGHMYLNSHQEQLLECIAGTLVGKVPGESVSA